MFHYFLISDAQTIGNNTKYQTMKSDKVTRRYWIYGVIVSYS